MVRGDGGMRHQLIGEGVPPPVESLAPMRAVGPDEIHEDLTEIVAEENVTPMVDGGTGEDDRVTGPLRHGLAVREAYGRRCAAAMTEVHARHDLTRFPIVMTMERVAVCVEPRIAVRGQQPARGHRLDIGQHSQVKGILVRGR